jgi:hypothetical protein
MDGKLIDSGMIRMGVGWRTGFGGVLVLAGLWIGDSCRAATGANEAPKIEVLEVPVSVDLDWNAPLGTAAGVGAAAIAGDGTGGDDFRCGVGAGFESLADLDDSTGAALLCLLVGGASLATRSRFAI